MPGPVSPSDAVDTIHTSGPVATMLSIRGAAAGHIVRPDNRSVRAGGEPARRESTRREPPGHFTSLRFAGFNGARTGRCGLGAL